MSPGRQAAVFALFAFGYFLFGLAGLQMQSAQAGVTPVWPASGFAFAMVYWFGLRQAVALLPAMLALGWLLGLSLQVVVIAALGSMLEAVLPVALLRRLDFDPRLRQLRDALSFVVLGAVLGPLFSATLGGLAMYWFGDNGLGLLRLWLLWWLGNSLGLLLVGGLGLVAVAEHPLRLDGRAVLRWLGAAIVVTLITLAGLLRALDISSPLFVLLLIPVFILVAQPGNQVRNLHTWELAAFAGFCALGHLDLDLFCINQVLAGDPKAAGGDLLDGATPRVAVRLRHVAGRVFAAFTRIAAAAQAVHGHSQCFMRFFADGAVRHSPTFETANDGVYALYFIQRHRGQLFFER
jgi:integral membrane sensor domain MASE1